MLSDEQRKLVEDNMNFIPYIVLRKLHTNSGDPLFEDLLQDGYLILCKCALTYDPDLGYAFTTYVGRSVEFGLKGQLRKYKSAGTSCKYSDLYSQIMKYLATVNPEANIQEICQMIGCSEIDYFTAIHFYDTISLDSIIYESDGGTDIRLIDTIMDPNNIGYCPSSEDLDEIASEVISRLKYSSDLHRDIFTEWIYSLIYDEGMSQVDLSSKYGLAQASVSRILKRYTKQFRNKLQDYILE